MPIRLWPNDYEKKDHLTSGEKFLLRNASKNFKSGHFVVDIDPIKECEPPFFKMGFYLSPKEGLISFSLFQNGLSSEMDDFQIQSLIEYVKSVEDKIYKRLLESKILIVKTGDYKILKFPYKHIILFTKGFTKSDDQFSRQIEKLVPYVAYKFFLPLNSNGMERRISDLKIFDNIRKKYDPNFFNRTVDGKINCKITIDEQKAVFEMLAPEYTIVMTEIEHVLVPINNNYHSEEELHITGEELEYKTFFLDEYQVGLVNDMGFGHRVILANPGAGKSVLLLSKAFKYANLYKDSKILLTCFNNNLADAYCFKRSCANFGDNSNLYIMTFHKLVKKIYEQYLNEQCSSNIATEEEIQRCIDLAIQKKLTLRFKAIFIDEVQIFDPLYLELCYLLLEDADDNTFLMAGDLNQTIRKKSRRGDVPWKKIAGVQLDFTGRVRYIKKNYRNSKKIGEYLCQMLKQMNNRMKMLNLINFDEFEYDTFETGNTESVALKVMLGINRINIRDETIKAIKEIVHNYNVSYSDIAVLFPYKKFTPEKYYFLYWLEGALKDESISYSLITPSSDGTFDRKRYSQTEGVVISTIDSSIGLDFKAVIVTGLYPFNYVTGFKYKKLISSWDEIKRMSDEDKLQVQSQMRAIYTACSRARELLYVLSDLQSGSPMEEILKY